MMPEDLHDDITVFICHAHEDNRSHHRRGRWLDRLLEHLTPLTGDYCVEFWSSRDITPGTHWHQEIQDRLLRTKIAVLLVSPAFLTSAYIRDHELPPLLTGADAGDVEIIPVHVRLSVFERVTFKYPDPERGPEQASLKDFQSAHDPSSPLSSVRLYEQDQVFIKVVEEILKLVQPRERRPGERRRQEALTSIRRKFLRVGSDAELKRVLSEVEEFLSLYPYDMEGRLLRDRIAEDIKLGDGRGCIGGGLVASPRLVALISVATLTAFVAVAYTSLPERLAGFIKEVQSPTPAPTVVGKNVPLRIIKPSDGDPVGRRYKVWGETPYPTLNHYLIVRPPRYGCVGFVEPSKVEVDESAWSGWAKFGDDSTGSGKQFKVQVLATAAQLPPGGLCSLPPDAHLSEPVTVMRR